MIKNHFRALCFISILFGASLFANPDLVVINADVRTSDKTIDRVSAFAVKGSKFITVGSTEDILAMAGDSTRVIDAKGNTVVPGFIDSQTHLSSGVKIVTGININSVIRNY